MKKLYLALVSCLLFGELLSQTPTYFNSNAATGNNTYPLGTTTNRKVQFRVTANSIAGVGPGNNITVVYFQAANNSTSTYPLLNISMKQNTTGFAGGGNFETGMTNVYSGTNVSLSSTTNGWMSFTLTTPFLYDPNQHLLIEIEHNSTNGNANIRQTNFGGPGAGRQWGDFGQTAYNGSDGNTVHFGIDVIPATPCTAPPPANSLTPVSFTTCPGIQNPDLKLTNTYSLGGLTYQWYESSVSGVGPFSAVANATLPSMQVPALSATTWYKLVATCTNVANASTTISTVAEASVVLSNIISTPPYTEDFEGILFEDRLPNCSWLSPQIGSSAHTFTAAAPGNLVPRSGQKFAAFENSPAGTSYYFTNGLSLTAGVTYSASVWYATDLNASLNWTDLSLLVGTSQSTTGLIPVASSNGPATSIVYKPLSGTFTVPSTGVYYIAVSATGGPGGAQHLVWDDLSVSIPCDLNTPTLSVVASETLVCQGDEVILTATGADHISWGGTGATGSVYSFSPLYSGEIVVSGSNNGVPCVATASAYLSVLPAPQINVLMTPSVACAGAPLYLTAAGGVTYSWSTGSNNTTIMDHPSENATYIVHGSNTMGCVGSKTVNVNVQQLPALIVEGPGAICQGESAQFTAQGAVTYKWMSNSIFITGNPVTVSPSSSINYTVEGTDANGCTGASIISVLVNACTSVGETDAGARVQVYPNPAAGQIHIRRTGQERGKISLTDLSGRELYQKVSSGDQVLDIAQLPAGVYIVLVENEERTESFRIVKE